MSEASISSHASSDDWLLNIASEAKVEPARVSEVLSTWRIQPSPVIPSPRRLLLKRIEFSGVKKLVPKEGPFSFSWEGLNCGLWGMVTQRNLKGKSSIIEIVEWLLRGRRSSNLQEDVWSWISKASLRFQLDEIQHSVEVTRESGFQGQLRRLDREDGHILASFSSEVEFEITMADFFMRQFSLEPVSNWQKARNDDQIGSPVLHGWAALSGVMFIGTDYSSLLGDLPSQSGVPIRLMQMYLGLPWIPTLTVAKAAMASVEASEKAKANKRAEIAASRRSRIEGLKAELVGKQAELENTPSDEEIRKKLGEEIAELSRLRSREISAVEKWRSATVELKAVEAEHAEDRHELQAFKDAQAASAVFRTLDPSCCPRCEATIGSERKRREEKEHSCSVCNNPIASDSDGEDRRIKLEALVEGSSEAVSKSQGYLAAAAEDLATLRAQAQQKEMEVQALNLKLAAFGSRARIQIDIAVLEGRIAEAGHGNDAVDEPVTDELKILREIVKETEIRMKAIQVGVLQKVSETILAFAQRFGIPNLTGASLKGNLSLTLEKGGTSTSYSKVTQGEKLRLKVATALAMIHVGETEGVGRHPGLLMLDSPGSEELAPEDLDQLISGLESISKEFKHLQVFVAARATPAIVNHIPADHRREAAGEDTLW